MLKSENPPVTVYKLIKKSKNSLQEFTKNLTNYTLTKGFYNHR